MHALLLKSVKTHFIHKVRENVNEPRGLIGYMEQKPSAASWHKNLFIWELLERLVDSSTTILHFWLFKHMQYQPSREIFDIA